ncbi:MAG: transporter [Candidatus Thiodiazotropha sp. (ex Lucinoma annulata)]|nr:transporter [Candidatus Thiodiazotropha sp. (ex Lucinoma borealis)]MCU7842187.1 transporter [Candidatus Thiodiazotropha sp. (ex Troendleina suluensis)]MCU7855425.1 transporter [Candidatus Thiodiazotropha sp. (ex Lucinoma borealis)]MCU7884780.1 transporter [Candidatus Thiodiazotropha sp. (ex Lucinoma annulata)]MCU7947175.1 transporter [Candidatus Thiodiazotropha sp. (ex Cardiolucina cf. quadrata)]
MKCRVTLLSTSLALACIIPTYALAVGDDQDSSSTLEQRRALSNRIKQLRALRKKLPIPVPSGLFGIYAFPEKGQGVAGINYQHHEFDGLIQGSKSVSAETVVTSAPNRFFGNPMQPPTLRVVPESARADVIFPFANFAINDHFALVALAPLIRKETVLETFSGGGGINSLGTKTVTTNGLGDIKFGTIFKAYNSDDYGHNMLFDAVLSAPTGSITEEDYNLTPMNTKVKTRLAYGMQLGSGTWDAVVGVVYWGKQKQWGWGAQYLATIPLESENSEGWRFGDKHEGTAWVSYEWQPDLVTSVRLRGETQDEIHGIDPKIYGPGLGANPDNYGGERAEVGIGINWMPALANNLSLELLLPIHQDRNGVQAEHEFSLALSWRTGFF